MPYAIVKTESEAILLNDYIKAGYYNEVPGASFKRWTDIVPVASGFAVEILDFMQHRPVPEFIMNGVEFADSISSNDPNSPFFGGTLE